MDRFELPPAIRDKYLNLYHQIQTSKDAIARMNAADMDTTELQLKVDTLEQRLDKIMSAFDIAKS